MEREGERKEKSICFGPMTPRIGVGQIRYVYAYVRTIARLYLAMLQNTVLYASYLASPSSLTRREARMILLGSVYQPAHRVTPTIRSCRSRENLPSGEQPIVIAPIRLSRDDKQGRELSIRCDLNRTREYFHLDEMKIPSVQVFVQLCNYVPTDRSFTLHTTITYQNTLFVN